jgi:ParB family chromosome partitioning protein
LSRKACAGGQGRGAKLAANRTNTGARPVREGHALCQNEAAREAKRVERRRVIENNKAWRSAETVRREWLARFITRKTPPAGAEVLVCAALLGGNHIFTRAMQDGHRLLCTLLGHDAEQTQPYATTHGIRERLAQQHTSPKAAVMLALVCVLCAWEESATLGTWRHPTTWDTQIMTALVEWGYTPSEVETLLTHTDTDRDDAPTPSEIRV